MLEILLIIQIVVSVLLITVILLQRTSSDGLSGLASGNNMGVVSARTAANFMTRTTMILAIIFVINSLVLANLSTKKSKPLIDNVNHSETHNKKNISKEVQHNKKSK